MSREERKLRKHFEEKARRELRKAKKYSIKRSGAAQSAAGLIAQIGPGFCDVVSAGQRIRCRPVPDLAVGDEVLFSHERRRVEEILPRRTALSRADPHNPRLERVIAANVDKVVIVVALKSPPLRPGLIDRYLIAIGKSRAEPILCVNKIDLLDGGEELEALRPYFDLGITVVKVSASTREGLGALSEALAGKICVFTGHSGVGKSSLLNALDPRLDLATGSVSTANDKGRHTTTSAAMYDLPNGAIVIDTPGIREWGLYEVSAADVRRYFHEFDAFPCAFSDCTHTCEPDCAVKAAVEAGAIPAARYRGYLRIISSVGASA